MKLLVLAGHHVHELLTYRECAGVMREALAQRARGEIQQPLRTMVRPRDAAGFMALMPAYSPGGGYALKAICITPGNPAAGLDAHQGGVLLFDVKSRPHERTSVIVTTNLPFERRTEVHGNERLVASAPDRLTRRGHILGATGESYRPRE